MELKAASLLVVAQVYQPGLIISEFRWAPDGRRTRKGAGISCQLEAGTIERPRHAGGTSARVTCV